MENTLMLFAIALLVSVVVHEFGHYAAFRFFGGRVDECSIGFGPAIMKKRVGDSTLSLRIIPLGGYVQPNMKDYNRYNYFQKIIFISAGMIMNFAIYLISFGIMSISHGKSFINGLVVAMDGLIYIVANIRELFRSLQIDMIFGSKGSVESQIHIVNELGNNIEFLMMLAMINLTLIFINILPIPTLDGGRMLMVSAEHLFLKLGVAKEKIEKVTNPIYLLSFIFIVGLIFLQILSANTFQLVENATLLKESYGMTNFEIFLWISLVTVFFINIIVFVSNRIDKIKRA